MHRIRNSRRGAAEKTTANVIGGGSRVVVDQRVYARDAENAAWFAASVIKVVPSNRIQVRYDVDSSTQYISDNLELAKYVKMPDPAIKDRAAKRRKQPVNRQINNLATSIEQLQELIRRHHGVAIKRTTRVALQQTNQSNSTVSRVKAVKVEPLAKATAVIKRERVRLHGEGISLKGIKGILKGLKGPRAELNGSCVQAHRLFKDRVEVELTGGEIIGVHPRHLGGIVKCEVKAEGVVVPKPPSLYAGRKLFHRFHDIGAGLSCGYQETFPTPKSPSHIRGQHILCQARGWSPDAPACAGESGALMNIPYKDLRPFHYFHARSDGSRLLGWEYMGRYREVPSEVQQFGSSRCITPENIALVKHTLKSRKQGMEYYTQRAKEQGISVDQAMDRVMSDPMWWAMVPVEFVDYDESLYEYLCLWHSLCGDGKRRGCVLKESERGQYLQQNW